jgi:hypothetical protein
MFLRSVGEHTASHPVMHCNVRYELGRQVLNIFAGYNPTTDAHRRMYVTSRRPSGISHLPAGATHPLVTARLILDGGTGNLSA